jgi:hypothetical protein
MPLRAGFSVFIPQRPSDTHCSHGLAPSYVGCGLWVISVVPAYEASPFLLLDVEKTSRHAGDGEGNYVLSTLTPLLFSMKNKLFTITVPC